MFRFLVVLLLASGCSNAERPSNKVEKERLAYGVQRFVDEEHGIICYTLYSDGISCLPLPVRPIVVEIK